MFVLSEAVVTENFSPSDIAIIVPEVSVLKKGMFLYLSSDMVSIWGWP